MGREHKGHKLNVAFCWMQEAGMQEASMTEKPDVGVEDLHFDIKKNGWLM